MAQRRGRPYKVGEQIQRELSDIIRRELRDPRIGMITLTAVEVSPDCMHAKVFFTCLERDHVPVVERGLRHASGFLRAHLARRMSLHAIPELHFSYDESVERGDRLSRLIDQAGKDVSGA